MNSNLCISLDEVLTRHNSTVMDSGRCQGWAIACSSPVAKRISYYGFSGEMVYDEEKVRVFKDKQEACFFLAGETPILQKLFKYTRLVAIADHPDAKAGQLPTVNGY